MAWIIGLIILLILGGLFGNVEDDYYEEERDYEEDDWFGSNNNNSSNNNSSQYDYQRPDESFITRDNHNEPPKRKNPNGYKLLIRVRNCKYARQEEITIEAHNRNEARQKAINMGYEVIRCT